MNIGNEYIKKKMAAGYHFLQFVWPAEIVLHQNTHTHTHVCSLLQHLKKNYISVTFMPKTHFLYRYIRWVGRFLKRIFLWLQSPGKTTTSIFAFNFGKSFRSCWVPDYDLQAWCMRTTFPFWVHREVLYLFYSKVLNCKHNYAHIPFIVLFNHTQVPRSSRMSSILIEEYRAI